MKPSAFLSRHLRVYRRQLITSAVLQLEYRANVVTAILTGAIELAVTVATFQLLYQHSPTVAGWTKADVLVVAGFARILSSMLAFQVTPNMLDLPIKIMKGDLDLVLLRPVSTRFLVSTARMDLPQLLNVAIGAGWASFAVVEAGYRADVPGVLASIWLLSCGILLIYCVWFAISTTGFWLVKVGVIGELFFAVADASAYPVQFFKGAVRTFLTFVVPVAFVTTFPVEALHGRAAWEPLLVAPVLLLVAFACTQGFWRLGLRAYTSASS
jgi:ABC-2 type transport system permease protein